MSLFSKIFGSPAAAKDSGSSFKFNSTDRALRPAEYGYATFTWSVEGGEALVQNSFMAGDGEMGMRVSAIVSRPRLAMLHAAILEAACYHVFARTTLRASDDVMVGVAKGFADGVAALQINGNPLPADLRTHLNNLLPQFALAIERDMRAAAGRDPSVVSTRFSEKVKLLFDTLAIVYPDASELKLDSVTPASLMVLHRVEATCDGIIDSLSNPEKHGVVLV